MRGVESGTWAFIERNGGEIIEASKADAIARMIYDLVQSRVIRAAARVLFLDDTPRIVEEVRELLPDVKVV